MNRFNNKYYLIVALFIIIFLTNCNDDTKIKAQKFTKSSFINYLKNTTWIITNEQIIGFDPKITSYELSLKLDTVQIWNFQAIEFLDSENFTSYDSWECGNDCFTATFGRYDFIDKDKIRLYTDSITSNGICQAPTKHLTKNTAEVFKILKNKDKITLIKSK